MADSGENNFDTLDRITLTQSKEGENSPLISQTTAASSSSYDSDNISRFDNVLLMDVSRDKKWICYVHRSRENSADKDIKITRCRFKAKNKNTQRTENIISESADTERVTDATAQSNDAVLIDVSGEAAIPEKSIGIITSQYSLLKLHCKFLSISPDGKYIVLSSYKVDDPERSGLEEERARCFIFEVKGEEILPCTELKKCNGRAVFLEQRGDGYCLAVINDEILKVYEINFTNIIQKVSYLYDLTPFASSWEILREAIAHQNSYIKENNSWVDMTGSNDNISDNLKKIMTFSRHIRDEVIVTPYSTSEGIVRVWSIKDDGVRLTSFRAPDEHIVAFSKDFKYAATVTDGIRAVNVYNVKNGLLVYTLNSRLTGEEEGFLEVTHARFCYDSRYLALSGLQKTDWNNNRSAKVIFEVWYIEAEKSIYGSTHDAGGDGGNSTKTIKPFVYRCETTQSQKCLKGVYTHHLNDSEQNETLCIELSIDTEKETHQRKSDFKEQKEARRSVPNEGSGGSDELEVKNSKNATNLETPVDTRITWLTSDEDFGRSNEFEVENDLDNYKHLKCAEITVGDKTYLVRFGNSMIQLWLIGNPNGSSEDEKNYQLVYIRAYRGPKYGLAYSFRADWEISNVNSIKFIDGEPAGRLIVNIVQSEASLTTEEQKSLRGTYHTEEIFLPLTKYHEDESKFDYHTFESACQALYYLQDYWFKEFYTNVPAMEFTSESKDQKIKEEDKIANIKFNAALRGLSRTEKERRQDGRKKKERLKKKLFGLFTKCNELIVKAVEESTNKNSNYFATMAGSRTLSMLASFSHGREIIKLLLKSKAAITFSIFSYPRPIREVEHINDRENTDKETEDAAALVRTVEQTNASERHDVISYRSSPKITEFVKGKYFSIAENENVLTVLIKELSYNLYKLMFNRILSDSKKIGPGCLSALADALIYLQEEGNTDLLLTSSQKLSYLSIDKSTLGILKSEIGAELKVKDLQKEYVSDIRNLECHSTMEQMQKYGPSWETFFYRVDYKWKVHVLYYFCKSEFLKWLAHPQKFFRKLFGKSRRGSKNRTKICVVPLPYFNTYNILMEDRLRSNTKTTKLWGIIKITNRERTYKKNSSFIAIASGQESYNIFRQGDTVLEVMLEYKWRKFVRTRFVGVFLIHMAYYISYCTGVLFAYEMYGYENGNEIHDNAQHLASIIIAFFSGSILLGQEIHQIVKSNRKIDYFESGYNWVDMAAFVLPLLTFLQLRLNMNSFYEICSLTTLVLWLHGILRLRVISFVGITLETIIQLVQKVGAILCILFFVVIAFTQAFMVLLRRQDDQFFQENYNGTTSAYESPTTVGTTNIFDISASNGFTDPYKAFYQVWLVIFGVWDPIINGNAGDDRMIFFLCIVFALLTVLIFTNMVIALMSSTVDEVKQKGKKVWVSHFAAVIAEIEQLWCFPATKRNRNNNPNYIYYIANYDAVQRQEEVLEEETKELRKKVFGIDDPEVVK